MKTSYNKNSENAQEKINQIIFDHKLKETDVARALGITPQNLHYQLHTATNLDREIEQGIFIYFRSVGIIQFTKDQCKLVTDNFLEFTALIHQQIAILSNTIRKSIVDEEINNEEGSRLLILSENLRKQLNNQIDELENHIRGLE
ncbi:MAG TPA: hypothetical protein PK665_15065 [Ignavibacteriaceae bacterium]|nr:hypothetical protein [Ignavibacteriaceae bacterium]